MDSEPDRLGHLDTFAGDIATALADHGFTYTRRIAGEGNDDDSPATIEHEATRTTLVVGRTGVLLCYYIPPTPNAPERTQYQNVCLSYSGGELPLPAMDLKPVVFL